MNPDFPPGILIPPISTIWNQNLTVTDNLHPLKQQWKNHFNCGCLTSDYKQQQTTYHWVAHLLTAHLVRIHHPIFGLTPIVEPTAISSNLTLSRTSLDETIVISSVTINLFFPTSFACGSLLHSLSSYRSSRTPYA